MTHNLVGAIQVGPHRYGLYEGDQGVAWFGPPGKVLEILHQVHVAFDTPGLGPQEAADYQPSNWAARLAYCAETLGGQVILTPKPPAAPEVADREYKAQEGPQQVPRLRKKTAAERGPVDPDSLVAALYWDRLAPPDPIDQPQQAQPAEKSLALTEVVEARVHEAFTVALDRAFQLGYLDRENRIKASNVIGDFLPKLSKELLTRVAGAGAQIQDQDLRTIAKAALEAIEKGGAGSGNWGHRGRPGQRGGSAAGGGKGRRVGQTQVGITSHRAGRTPGQAKAAGEEWRQDLEATTARNVNVQFGIGGYEGGREPTYVTTYEGNGEALKAAARFGKKYEQDAVIVQKFVEKGTAGAEPMDELSFNRALTTQQIRAAENIIGAEGIGGWTWSKGPNGNTRLQMTFIPDWADYNRDTHSWKVDRIRRYMDSAGTPVKRFTDWVKTTIMYGDTYDAYASGELKALLEKGGPGSGNWGHHGAPGRGGSSRGTGAARNLYGYKHAKRRAMIANSPAVKAVDDAFRANLREKNPDQDQETIDTNVEMLHDALQLGADRFDHYGPKYGVDPSLKEAYYTDIAVIDDNLKRREQQVKDQATATNPINGKPVFTVHDDPAKDGPYHENLVGRDYQEAEATFTKRFGVPIRDRTAGGLGGEVDPEVRHRNASAMYNAASDNPVVAKVLESGHVQEIVYERPKSYDTAWASWDGAKISIKGMDWAEKGERRYPFPAGLFVHEVGHAVQSYGRDQGILPAGLYRLFGRGKTVSSYGWENAGEDFAETFRAWSVGDPAVGFRDHTPRKHAYMDELAKEILK